MSNGGETGKNTEGHKTEPPLVYFIKMDLSFYFVCEGRNVCFMEVIGVYALFNRAAPGRLGALDEI